MTTLRKSLRGVAFGALLAASAVAVPTLASAQALFSAPERLDGGQVGFSSGERGKPVLPGGPVVANGRGFHTGAALPRVLDGLAARGYRFVTVGELLKRGRPVVAATCYDGRPGDTDRYGPFGLVRATTGPAAPTAPAPLPLRKAVP